MNFIWVLVELGGRLKGAEEGLGAMTLGLGEQRKRAEETLTRLAAAQTEAAKAVEGQTNK